MAPRKRVQVKDASATPHQATLRRGRSAASAAAPPPAAAGGLRRVHIIPGAYPNPEHGDTVEPAPARIDSDKDKPITLQRPARTRHPGRGVTLLAAITLLLLALRLRYTTHLLDRKEPSNAVVQTRYTYFCTLTRRLGDLSRHHRTLYDVLGASPAEAADQIEVLFLYRLDGVSSCADEEKGCETRILLSSARMVLADRALRDGYDAFLAEIEVMGREASEEGDTRMGTTGATGMWEKGLRRVCGI